MPAREEEEEVLTVKRLIIRNFEPKQELSEPARAAMMKMFGSTIQVGWSVECQNGEPFETWWGNTKNEESLQALIGDLRAKGYEPFEVEDRRAKE